MIPATAVFFIFAQMLTAMVEEQRGDTVLVFMKWWFRSVWLQSPSIAAKTSQ